MDLEVYPVSVSFDNRDPRRDRPFETRKPSEIETHGLVSKKHQGNYVPIECIYVKGTINIGISMYAVSKNLDLVRSRYQSRSSRLGNLGRDRPLLGFLLEPFPARPSRLRPLIVLDVDAPAKCSKCDPDKTRDISTGNCYCGTCSSDGSIVGDKNLFPATDRKVCELGIRRLSFRGEISK